MDVEPQQIQLGATDYEIDWMLAHRPLEFDLIRLQKDHTVDEAAKIVPSL